jgi:hypothetical protein
MRSHQVRIIRLIRGQQFRVPIREIRLQKSRKKLKSVDMLPAYPIGSPLYFAGETHSVYEKEIHFAIRLL